MNLAHLNYFKTLAERRNYRDAAYDCSVSQSTLSTAINGLEKELGCALFVRKKGSVDLTEPGATFYQYVNTSLRFLNNGIDLVKEKSGKDIKEITIGTIFSAQSKNWSRLIYDFRREMHGDVQINVIQSTTPDLIEKLKDGQIDVAFAGTLGPDEDLVQHSCWTQEVVLVVNRSHPFAAHEEISLEDLRNHYLISYNLEGPVGRELTGLVRGRGLSIDCLYEDEITLGSIVAANPDVMAIACRSWLLDSFHDEAKLVRIAEAPTDFRQLYFSYRANSEKPRVVNDFIKMATDHWPR